MLIIIVLTISYTCVQNLDAFFFIENISFRHQLKNKQWNNIGAVPKSNGKIVEIEAKSIPLTHIYTAQYVSSECSTRDTCNHWF